MSTPAPHTNDWFVVKTNSRCEKKVNQQLTELGYTTFLPLITSYRQWSDRIKKVELPLIPSTLFVQNINVNKNPLYELPGFHYILKEHEKIGIVRDEEIERLKIVIGEEMDITPTDPKTFLPGDEIEVMAGPLLGHYAKAIEEENKYRILIKVEALGVHYSVSIAKNKVRKIK